MRWRGWQLHWSQQTEKPIEEVAGIFGARGRLRMKLHTHERTRFVSNSFIRPVVGIHEPGFPSLRESFASNGVPVVLRGDITAPRANLETGLIVAAMPELQFIRISSSSQGENLIPEANAKD